MKKRMMSLLLTLAMLLSLVPAFGTAASAEEHSHSYTNGICACGACNGTHSSDDGWTALTQDVIDTAVSGTSLSSDNWYYVTLPAGKYYLASDISIPGIKYYYGPNYRGVSFRFAGDTALCLNGHILSGVDNGLGYQGQFSQAANSHVTLDLYDCGVDTRYICYNNDVSNISNSDSYDTVEQLLSREEAGRKTGDNYVEIKGGIVGRCSLLPIFQGFENIRIYGGNYTGNTKQLMSARNEIEVNGGTFVANTNDNTLISSSGSITINGGCFVANKGQLMSADSITINGGEIVGNTGNSLLNCSASFYMTGGQIVYNMGTVSVINISDSYQNALGVTSSSTVYETKIIGGVIENNTYNSGTAGRSAIRVEKSVEGYPFVVGGTAKIRKNKGAANPKDERNILFISAYGMPYITVENPQSGMEVALGEGMEVHGATPGDEQYFYAEGLYNTTPVTNKYVCMSKYGNLYVASGSAPASGTGSVTLHANDGALAAYTASSGSDYSVSYTTDSFTLPIPAKSGYYFEGWYTDSGLSGTAATTATDGGEYWAKWSSVHTHATETYTVSVENYIKLTQEDFSTSNTDVENFVYYDSTNHTFKLKSGHYWLSENVTLPKDGETACSITFTSEASFCMDGHVLDLNDGKIVISAHRVIIEDCKHDEDHKYYYTVAENTGLWTLAKNGDAYVTSGTGGNYVTGGVITGSDNDTCAILIDGSGTFLGAYTYDYSNPYDPVRSTVVLNDVNVIGNNIHSEAQYSYHSVIRLLNNGSTGSALELNGNALVAGNVGTGIYVQGGSNYGFYASLRLMDYATVTENTFIGNSCIGGGIHVGGKTDLYLCDSSRVLGNYYRSAAGGEKWDADIFHNNANSASNLSYAATVYVNNITDEPQYGFFGVANSETYIKIDFNGNIENFNFLNETLVDNMAPKNDHTIYYSSYRYLLLNGNGEVINNKPIESLETNHGYLYVTRYGGRRESHVNGAPSETTLRLHVWVDTENGYDIADITAQPYGSSAASVLSTYDASTKSFSITMPANRKDITVDAIFTQSAPTLIYHYNDGGTTADKTTYYSNVLGCDTLETPSRSGYAFAGWYDNAELTGTRVTSLPAGGGAKNLYAKWGNAANVTLNTNGGTINSGNITQYPEGTGTALPTDVTKPGKVFVGWYDNEGLTGTVVTEIPASATGTMTYWAKWGYTYFSITNSTPEANADTNHGYITVVPTADYEDSVDVTVVPAAGYRLNSLSYTGATSGKVKITNISNGVATFTMPAEAITLKASFKSGSGIDFRYPVYVDNDVSKGIHHWEDGVCETANQAYPGAQYLGTTGQDTWYYTTTGTYVYNSSSFVTIQGNVHLILTDGTTATFSKGLVVLGDGSSLTIYGQANDTGKLIATSDTNTTAGIGGQNTNGGNIIINGGVIEATGGTLSAGIGGGGFNKTGSNIVINGGTVTATGGTYGSGYAGAGIGGGANAAGSNIIINGGIITANGGSDGAAGIGGGSGGKASYIDINGGIITATGGTNSVGIGGGYGTSALVDSDNITVDAALVIKADSTTPPSATVTNNGTDIATESSFLKQYVTVEPDVSGYTVSFDANGGTGSMTAVSATSALYTLPDCAFTAPAHKKFDGWSLTQNGTKITTSSIVLTGNTTLFARWINVYYYTVIWKNYDNSTIKTEVLEEGTTPAYAGTPTRTGNDYVTYTFAGWSQPIAPVTSDVTFTAQYNATKSPVQYKEPVYVNNTASKGIDYWETEYCFDYSTVSSLDTTWGNDGAGRWYVLAESQSFDAAITLSGDVKLILTDNCTLTATKGIVVTSGNSLTIYSTSLGGSMGKIVATGSSGSNSTTDGAAGIGSRYYYNNGAITINGGDITASGGSCDNSNYYYGGAGIGGVYNRDGSNITINAGRLSATGSNGGAGIGGGYNAAGSNIIINGGTITAVGSNYNSYYGGAGIGGGYNRAGSNITINGGSITANAGYSAAAIGGGYNYTSYSSAITVSNNLTIKAGSTANPTTEVLASRAVDADIAKESGFKVQYVTIAPSSTYTVTFYSNGGSGSMAAESGICGSYTLPIFTTFTAPVSTKELKGWSYTAGGEMIATRSIPISQNTDLYAVWGETTYYTVTWKNEDGTTLKQDQMTRYQIPSYSGTMPAKESVGILDYVFAGWTPEVAPVSDDVTYTAMFKGTSASGVAYLTPVYKIADTPTSGLERMDYAACANADCTTITTSTITTATTWGAAGTDSWYVIDGTVTYGYAVTVSGNVHLILKDGCTLNAQAGIIVKDTNTLSIYAQSTGEEKGELVASGSDGSAGIGGSNYVAGGNTTINGGVITATGSSYCAGIGGGYYSAGSNIIINGGVITATGGSYGAGIGGGRSSVGSNIIINGGTVTASGGSNGTAGIGSGYSGSAASNINISKDLLVKANTTNPPTTTIKVSGTDYASSLSGSSRLQYVTITLKTVFSVSFNANEGSGSMSDVDDIVGSYTLPANGFTSPDPDNLEFKGWAYTADGAIISTDSINVDKDTMLYAKWGNIIVHYDITWKNYDNSQLAVDSVGTGSMPVYTGTPSKPDDDNYTYVFTGWSPTVVPVTGEATYTAQYKKVLKVGPAFANVKYTVSLVLGEKIDMQLTIKNVPSGFDASALTVTVTPEGETGKQISVSKDNSGNYVGIMYSAKPTEMSKLLTCTVTYNGVQARDPFNYSVLTYCTNKLKAGSGASSNLKALCKAMLNYGAWAQLQFNEATDNLANKNLEAADKLVYSADFDTQIVTPNVTSPVLPEGIDNISATLILNEETTVKFYLETTQVLKDSDVSVKSDKAGEIGLTMERDKANNCYIVTIPKIGAHRLGYLFTVTVKGVEFNYGPYSYCKAVNSTASGEEITETLKTLGMAIYNYGEAAKAYRANPNG